MIRIFLLICSLLFVIGCKQETKNTTETDAAAAADAPKKMSEADLGGLYKYYHANPTTLEQKDENTLIEYIADKGLTVGRTPGGVFIHMTEEGNGDKIKWGDPLVTNYRGYFLDGEEFDSSYKRNKPLGFKVGQMIPGWNEALSSRRKGDKFTLFVPSHMAYGKRGFPGFVGPDKILVFDIEILNE